jgi:nucleoside-diphosphate-sugar epimerase
MKKILVTGGTGFIGSAIARNLAHDGFGVRILDNDSRGNVENLNDLKNDVEFYNGDIRDFDLVRKAMKGVDTVCHLAYVNGTKNFYTRPYEILEIGIKGMFNILEASKINDIQNIVLASTSEVYQQSEVIPTPEEVVLKIPNVKNPRYSYGGGKIASELLLINFCRQNLISYQIFRPHNIYGPNMGNDHVIPELINKILDSKNSEITIQGTGNETRSFCFIDDFIQSFRLILTKGQKNEIYNIGSEEEISIKRLINVICAEVGTEVTLNFSELTEGSAIRRCPDLTKIKALGYTQNFDINLGIQKTLKWHQG